MLLENLPDEEKEPELLRNLCHLLVHEAFFQFKDTFYKQTIGVPIGSPLAGILAELIVRRKKTEVFHTLLPTIKLYRRYIDDVIIIREKTNNQKNIEQLFRDESLRLTIKKVREDQQEISYLDINIRIIKGEYQTGVYRKSTYIPLFIHKESREPWHTKMAAFKALLYRIKTYCTTTESINEEIDWIMQQAEAHGYNQKIIMRIWNNMKRKNGHNNNRQNYKEKMNEEGPPYIIETNPISMKYRDKIQKAAQKKIVYTRNNTVFNLTRNDKDRRKMLDMPGVYQIPIENKDSNREEIYIGSIARSLQKRIQEHQTDQEKKRSTTALAQRLSSYDATPKWKNSKLLSKIENPEKLKIAEMVEIHDRKATGNYVINYNEPQKLSLAWQYCCKRRNTQIAQ